MSNPPNKTVVRNQAPPNVSKGPRELDSRQKQLLIDDDWSLLTGSKGVAEVSSSQSQYVALVRLEKNAKRTKPVTLFVVAKDYAVHPDVSTVRNIIRRKSISVSQEVYVDMATVRAIYEKASLDSTSVSFQGAEVSASAAEMQKTFISLLEIAAKSGSSDIHINVDKYTALIRIRSDGVMTKLREMPSGPALELCNAVFNMTETSEATYKPLDYQQARMTEGSLKGLKFPKGVQSVRLQFNPLPAGGRYLVARLLYDQKVGSDADIDELGYTKNQIQDIRKMRRKTIGINIICGPTGSGKSTTLQRSLTATLRERPGINAITIEDPPEYIIEGATQLPVVSAITQEERTLNFTLAMNAVLRDDPDMIMIGEIRDVVSANLAYSAAETGHGVWASLHANSAIGILDRLRDLGLELFKLCDASKFTGLVGQRLVRKIHPNYKCDFKEAVDNKLISHDVANRLEELAGDKIANVRFAATHKVKVFNEAYKGRTVCAETILLDQEFLDIYLAGKKTEALRYWKSDRNGMDMLEHGLALVLQGSVDVRAVEDSVGLIEDISVDRVEAIMKLVGME